METKKTNEINLMDVIIETGKWLKKTVVQLLEFSGKILILLYKHKIITACILILSIAVGQYKSRPSARKYNMEGMCVLYGPEAKTISEIGKQLAYSSPRFQATSLARKLSLPDSIASKVTGVEFFQVIDYQLNHTPDLIDFKNSHSMEDTLNLPMIDYIYMRIKIIGTSNANAIGDAMLKYINTNPTVQNQYEILKGQLNEKIRLCDAEMFRLDSLAKITYFEDKKPEIKFESNKLLIGNNTIQLFYNDMLTLQTYKTNAQNRLLDAKQPVVVPSGFVVNPKAINGRAKYGIYSLIIGLLLSIFVSFFLENRKKWAKYLQNN